MIQFNMYESPVIPDGLSEKYPDIKTLAFWCRKKNILNLQKKLQTDEPRLGLGLIFHITPSNIPTNFAYSLIFGLLTGNSNIVKIPSKKFEQIARTLLLVNCACALPRRMHQLQKSRILVRTW